MLEITVDRIRPLVPPERVMVITARHLVSRVSEILPDVPGENIIGEPMGRNTGPCAALAGRIAERMWGPEAVLLFSGTDYRIGKPDRFLEIVARAAEFAADGDRIVTLGLAPTGPETGYGYIEREETPTATGDSVPIYPVLSYREKPDPETAREYCDSGRFLWNSGMFLWTAGTVRKDIGVHVPGIGKALDGIEGDLAGEGLAGALERAYPELPSISIDHAVMEKVDHVYVAPADIEWDDVGSWRALERHLGKDRDGNVVAVPHVSLDTKDCIVAGEGGLVATLGVENLLIVRAGDVVLVADKRRDQEVKDLLALVKGNPDLEQFL